MRSTKREQGLRALDLLQADEEKHSVLLHTEQCPEDMLGHQTDCRGKRKLKLKCRVQDIISFFLSTFNTSQHVVRTSYADLAVFLLHCRRHSWRQQLGKPNKILESAQLHKSLGRCLPLTNFQLESALEKPKQQHLYKQFRKGFRMMKLDLTTSFFVVKLTGNFFSQKFGYYSLKTWLLL